MKRKMKHFVSLFLVLIFTLQLFAAVPASAIGTAEEPSDTLEEISVQKEAPEPEAELGEPQLPKQTTFALNGQGTAEAPYQVTNETDWNTAVAAINSDSATYSKQYYEITADIQFTKAVTPVAVFSGTLDGGGHTMTGLTVDSDTNEAALIATNNGTIRDLGLAQVRLSGPADQPKIKRASFAVYNRGTISGCYATGDLSGGWRTGGIVTENYGKVENCYFVGSVTGRWETGGIAAWCADNKSNAIQNCYARTDAEALVSTVGVVAGYAYAGTTLMGNVALGGDVLSPGSVGRLLGKEKSTPITYQNNLACTNILVNNSAVSSNADNMQGLDKTAEELKQQNTYTAIGWDFSSVWAMDETLGRPVLQGCPEVQDALEREMPDGKGTEESPYLISNAEELTLAIQAINAGGAYAEAYYQLDADIMLKKSIPSILRLGGTLDGGGHTIDGYTLSTKYDCDALILCNEGTVKALGLTNVNVTGPNTPETSRRGGLCYQNRGTIEQCYVKGSVSGGHRSGGITAENYATISNCYFMGSVTGHCETGGIAAWNQATGVVENCYVSGSFTTETNNSGCIGGYGYTNTRYEGNVVLSGSTLSTANDRNHARICGRNNGNPTFSNNLSCTDVTINGKTVTGGAANNMQGLDKTAEELKQQNTYTAIGWDFSSVWAMDETLNRPVLLECREAPEAPDLDDPAHDKQHYTVASPDGSVEAYVYVNAYGELGYSVTLNGTPVLLRSSLGLTMDSVEMGKNATLGEPKTTTVQESYETRGMHTQAENHYNQSAFPVTSGEKTITLNVRAYNDGIAIQYDLPEGAHTISGDNTRFTIPTDAKAFYQYGDGSNYEGIKNMQVPTETSLVSAIGEERLLCTLPTFELKEKAAYVCITEANLYDWSGMGLRSEGEGVLKAEYWDTNGTTFTTEEDSPWRVAIIADNLNDFVNSDMVTNVSDPMEGALFADDTSWIQPGRSVWTTQGGGASTVEGYKEYSDYASQLGIEFNLIEARNGFGDTLDEQFAAIKEIADYSAGLENPVKIWLWEDAPTSRYTGGLYTEENARDFLSRCRKAGVVGVKIDHIHSESPDKVSFYEDFTRLAAEYHIMVSYHNPMKPTGLSRTYPNEMTREAIRGMQYQCNPNENAILPFTRLLAGGADYTPMNFSNSGKLGRASWVHMLANTVIMTSSYLQLSENPKNMVNQVYTDFIKNLPTVWDETIVLEQSEIGEAAAFLRRSGEDWYLAVQNSAHSEQAMTFDLDFLGEGQWYADIYYDNMNSAAQIQRRVEQVTKDSQLEAQIRSGGGYVVRLTQDEVIYDSDKDKVFEINTAEDLDLIREHPDATFNLNADLTLSGEFTPIPMLNGTLNGNGHTISGLQFTGMDASAALILQNNGTIRQLGLTNVYMEGPYTADNSWRASLCVKNYGTIEECYALGTVTGGHRTGGLVSENHNVIRNCYFIGTLESNFETGGITSWNREGSATVEYCYASGDFTSAGNNMGFISGYAYGSTRMTGNVALSGTLTGTKNLARICGRNNGVDENTVYHNNLACRDITINGKPVTGGAANNKDGADKTTEELKQQKTYAAIGWDFSSVWAMDTTLGRPVLKQVKEIACEQPVLQNSVSLAPGSDETSRNLTWYANDEAAGIVYWAKESDLVNGAMPEGAKHVQASVTEANRSGYYSNQATMSQLEQGTTYAYQLVNGAKQSPVYTFTTEDASNGFTFLFMGDPQLGASGNLISDNSGWNTTLRAAAAKVPDAAFLLSAGDQVNTANNEGQYTAYLDQQVLYSLPVATVIGNHDNSSNAYGQHFNVPNESGEYGTTDAGSDYWFRYGNVLFLVLNVNNMSDAEHRMFMEKAMAQNQDAEWNIVTMHHSVYSVANHALENDIIQRRNTLVPIFEELGIDVVLQGHDHVYVRTYMMDDFNAVTESEKYTDQNGDGVPDAVTDPDGILYVTANSASGSKYYNIKTEEQFPYAAVKSQEHVPTYSEVTITDTEFSIVTYRVSNGSVVDAFTIHRTEEETPDAPVVEGFKNGASSLDLTEIGRYDSNMTNADGGVMEIVDYNETTGYAYAINGQTGRLSVISLQDLQAGETIKMLEGTAIDIKSLVEANGFVYGDMTSVAVSPDGKTLAAALQAKGYADAGRVALFTCNSDGTLTFVRAIEVGVQPDMLTFTPDGSKILTANEGEPRMGYANGVSDPAGSVTIIDTATGSANTVGFDAFDGEKRQELVKAGVVLMKNTQPSVDLEPEYIACTNGMAYVTLQEANAIAVLDLAQGTFTGIYSAGFEDYSKAPVDIDKGDKAYAPSTYAGLKGIRMPDGIALYTVGDTDYLLTANEGDAREWDKYSNENEVGKGHASPAGNITKGMVNGKVVYFKSSDFDGLDPQTDYLFGGRSFTLYRVDGSALTEVFTSGSDFEAKTASYLSDYFNCSNDDRSIDDRSGKKGPEPETVTVGKVDGRSYAFVTLERIGGVMVYDITDPANVAYVNYINSRDFSEDVAADDSPEGLKFIDAKSSPTGNALLLAACEVGGTVAVYELEGRNTSTGGSGSTTTYYTITVTQREGGRINPGSIRVARRGDKTFTITPDEGYEIADVLVDGKSVGSVRSYTFENVMTQHTITAEFVKTDESSPVSSFTDVKVTDWFADAVQYMVDNHFMNGTSGTSFSPGGNMTRAMVMTVLARMAGVDTTTSSVWYEVGRAWAMENGISDGTNMDGKITREQLATMLYRYAKLTGADVSMTASLDRFQDADCVSSYATDALQWAAAVGIITGRPDGTIAPQAGATRAETAAMLMRFSKLNK